MRHFRNAENRETTRADGVVKLMRERAELVQLELRGLSEEYEELSETWKLIDTKAQVTASVAGVFLGGMFAIQRLPSLSLDLGEKFVLVIALSLLVASIVCAMKGLQLRNISFPPRGASAGNTFDFLYLTSEFQTGGVGLVERILRHNQEQIKVWRVVNAKTLRVVDSKGKWTLRAQWLFAAGASLFAVHSIYEFVSKVSVDVGAV